MNRRIRRLFDAGTRAFESLIQVTPAKSPSERAAPSSEDNPGNMTPSDPLFELARSAARDVRSCAPQFPNTFDPSDSAATDPRVETAQVFEPALAFFPRAFRWGEPSFTDASLREPWSRARRRVISHLLRAVAASQWKDHLILRGSVLLKTWLGTDAREPGDLDWVIVPATLNVTEPFATQLGPAHQLLS